MDKFELTPKLALGDFKLGSEIGAYFEENQFTFRPKDQIDENDSNCYELSTDGLKIFVDDFDRIESLVATKNCFYKNENLIGKKIQDFLHEENYPADLTFDSLYFLVEGKGQTQKVYDLDELGLQLWVYRGRIVTAIIWNPDQFEE